MAADTSTIFAVVSHSMWPGPLPRPLETKTLLGLDPAPLGLDHAPLGLDHAPLGMDHAPLRLDHALVHPLTLVDHPHTHTHMM